jgi:hypothetical protein
VNKKTIIIAVVILSVMLSVAYALTQRGDIQKLSSQVNSFEECVAAGYPVMEKYPQECVTPDGAAFERRLSKDESVGGFDGSGNPYPIDSPDGNYPVGDEDAIACTMDAMECPDGSFVGRIPPTCEFAQCPGVSSGTDL